MGRAVLLTDTHKFTAKNLEYFRQGADGSPTFLQDINYRTCWLKANGSRLGIDVSRAGLSGQSSGGHLAALVAMRPGDPRYSEIVVEGESGVDGKIDSMVLELPMINPLSRYCNAKRWLGISATERRVEKWKSSE